MFARHLLLMHGRVCIYLGVSSKSDKCIFQNGEEMQNTLLSRGRRAFVWTANAANIGLAAHHSLISNNTEIVCMNSHNDAKLVKISHECGEIRIILLLQQQENTFAQFLVHLADERKVGHVISYPPNADQL
jgi:hypothetical protein